MLKSAQLSLPTSAAVQLDDEGGAVHVVTHEVIIGQFGRATLPFRIVAVTAIRALTPQGSAGEWQEEHGISRGTGGGRYVSYLPLKNPCIRQ